MGDSKGVGMIRWFETYHQGGISPVVRSADSEVSTVATCNILQVKLPVQPQRMLQDLGEKGEG